MNDFETNFSRRVLVRLVVLGALGILVGLASQDFIINVYFRGQLTAAGWIINGAILALFVLGLAKVIGTLLRYMWEESALARFVRETDKNLHNPIDRIKPGTIIYQRVRSVEKLSKLNAPINHNALAAMLLANESTRISFPKFINNILILTGVFGTIVSLSIALIGASNLLETAQGVGNMGLVIHGMSTALSTTITAIICYVFYGYFYLKLTDAQTHLLSGIEQVTSLYLLPQYARSTDSILHDVTKLLSSLRHAAESLRDASGEHAEASARLRDLMTHLQRPGAELGRDAEEIKQLLRDGFRLPPEAS